jgi:SagB-type dehydrogenase family enzyme
VRGCLGVTCSVSTETVLRYHDATKHQFGRFAPALGYLDWASQPDPFRRYTVERLIELPRGYASLPDPHITLASIGQFLRGSMGLSAWKQYATSRWALRVNPSSGNLHPTEAYVVWDGCVWHYAPREHALELRAELGAWPETPSGMFLVALTSIHWREAWKYGVRAFRYCQHDVGHALGALRVAASHAGWRMQVVSGWSDAQMATLLGLDREADYADAEREDPDCVAIVTAGDEAHAFATDPAPLLQAAREATWHGVANRLSANHVEWPIIEEVAAATRHQGSGIVDRGSGAAVRPRESGFPIADAGSLIPSASAQLYSREVILQRRSATAFNPRYALRRETFFAMLARLQPGPPPWDVIDWAPHVHLAMFVHRVEGMVPGIYAYLRDPAVLDEWRRVMRPEFLWEQPEPSAPLYLLVPIDCRRIASRVSCDQEIAEDGFFSLGMIARLESALVERGASFYRRLYWECGIVGQVLYLEAEAASARGTGIGCFYDDPVHEMLGLSGHEWQSLYHFSMGMPIEDTRLTSEPGYAWEPTGSPPPLPTP